MTNGRKLVEKALKAIEKGKFFWIPSSLATPADMGAEANGKYFICTTTWSFAPVDFIEWYDGWNCCAESREYELDEGTVVAWMPLPPRYKKNAKG